MRKSSSTLDGAPSSTGRASRGGAEGTFDSDGGPAILVSGVGRAAAGVDVETGSGIGADKSKSTSLFSV